MNSLATQQLKRHLQPVFPPKIAGSSYRLESAGRTTLEEDPLHKEVTVAFSYVPGNLVEVPQIPYQETITLPASKTALVVVDMQNDFVKEKGSLRMEAAAARMLSITSKKLCLYKHPVEIPTGQSLTVGSFPKGFY